MHRHFGYRYASRLTAFTAGLSAILIGCLGDSRDGQAHSLVAGSSFVDQAGRTWLVVGEVIYQDLSLDELGNTLTEEPADDFEGLPLEEVARLLRPKSEFGGVEFELSDEDALEFAQHVLDMIAEQREDEENGTSGAPGGAPTNPESGIGVSQSPIIIGTDDRININSSAHSYPYSNHGQGGTTANPWCTCIKMINNHTCVTSAHCQHTGTSWITRRPITFRAGSSSPLPALPAGCYARTVPSGWNGSNTNYDYAVLALRGYLGASCNLNHYNVGWLGWNVTVSGSSIDAWVSGYPAPPPMGWSYPTLVYDFKSPGAFQSSAVPAQLYHQLDTSGGQSGAGVITSWSDGSFRVRGIHWGAPNQQTNGSVRMTNSLHSWLSSYSGF
jgi:V8-like Glu-specific endopeptidase